MYRCEKKVIRKSICIIHGPHVYFPNAKFNHTHSKFLELHQKGIFLNKHCMSIFNRDIIRWSCDKKYCITSTLHWILKVNFVLYIRPDGVLHNLTT
jgi:hypothetical protein